jgi:anti-sigma B factor antagonist
MSQPKDRIWVALNPPTAFIRVEGRGSFKISSALKEFGAAAVSAGCATLLFDLADCIGMDSTFMGVLAGMAGRLKREARGEIVLLNMTPRTRGLVATLGLDHIVQSFESGAAPERYAELLSQSQRMKSLDAGGESRREINVTMLQAHEDLVKINPENLPRFKDVLTFLREDLKKAESNGAK